MNWGKILLAGVLGGIVMMIANFVMHGIIMGSTYMEYPEVFVQEETGVGWFALVSVMIGIGLAILFAKTRLSWASGLVGGAAFGAIVGLTHFFQNFYDALVYEGFPYFLAWCHGGMDLIAFALGGASMGFILQRE